MRRFSERNYQYANSRDYRRMLPTNCFIVTDEETGISAVIDPGFISDELYDRIKELKSRRNFIDPRTF